MPTLDWLNRASAFTTAAKVPYRLLEQVSAHTSHAENTTNSIATQAINTPASVKNGTKSISVLPELVEGSEASTLRQAQDRTSSARTGVFDNLLIQGDKRPASGNVLHRDGLNMKQQLDALLAA